MREKLLMDSGILGASTPGLAAGAGTAAASTGGLGALLGSSAALPVLGAAMGLGSLITGIMKAKAEKKRHNANVELGRAQNEQQIRQQGVAQQNAALEALMRRL